MKMTTNKTWHSDLDKSKIAPSFHNGDFWIWSNAPQIWSSRFVIEDVAICDSQASDHRPRFVMRCQKKNTKGDESLNCSRSKSWSKKEVGKNSWWRLGTRLAQPICLSWWICRTFLNMCCTFNSANQIFLYRFVRFYFCQKWFFVFVINIIYHQVEHQDLIH